MILPPPEGDLINEKPYFYDMDSVALNEWHDRSNVKTLTKCIDDNCESILSSGANKDKLSVNQTQAALSFKSAKDFFADVGGTSLLKIASKHNLELLDSENFYRNLRAAPVFQVDFVTSNYGDLNKRANEMIRKYNVELMKND